MSSQDLLNQPLTDDNKEQLEGAQAIEAFLQGKSPAEENDSPATDAGVAGDEDDAMKALSAQIERTQKALDRTNMSPEKRYVSRLEEAGISLEEAREIIDRVMVQLKAYEDTYTIWGDVSVTFCTRMPEDIERLRNVLEQTQPKFQATREFESAKHNLAASLVRYHTNTFSHASEEDIAKILAWLRKVPVPVFTNLQQKLYEFDQKINLVFSPGYLENF